MTMQSSNTLIYNNILTYNNEEYYVSECEELFEPYLKMHNIVLYPSSIAWMSGCCVIRIDRRYTATWMIENDMLFLVDIQANLLPKYILEEMGIPSSECYAGLDFFFPADEKKIFADWYSGELSFLSYEDEQRVELLSFAIDKGRVTGKELQNYKKYQGYPYEKDDSGYTARSCRVLSKHSFPPCDEDEDCDLPF